MTNDKHVKKTPSVQERYHVAELYGRDFSHLTSEEIRHLTAVGNEKQDCPFCAEVSKCNKKGGVCSLRLYRKRGESISVPDDSLIVTTCPRRFMDGGLCLSWIAKRLIDDDQPKILNEIKFLKSVTQTDEEGSDSIGKIDMILVHPDTTILRWCAVEMQAVYFSGKGMTDEFKVLAKWVGRGIPWPGAVRRPDFRSSGPKRLMPQLQIKVPTLARWGKKTAVVIDLAFWKSLAEMQEANDVSNSDIVWFVVNYQWDEAFDRNKIVLEGVHYTTLEHAVYGLTAGEPSTLKEFESRIVEKLQEQDG